MGYFLISSRAAGLAFISTNPSPPVDDSSQRVRYSEDIIVLVADWPMHKAICAKIREVWKVSDVAGEVSHETSVGNKAEMADETILTGDCGLEKNGATKVCASEESGFGDVE